MLIRCESIFHYLAWLRAPWHYSFAGYSDAEWNCIFGNRSGEKTALGQVIDTEHGKLLADVLRRRQGMPNFLFAIPKCLYQLPGFAEGQIDWWLGRNDIRIDGFERDMVLDDLARDAGLYPFIRQLQDMRTVMIGPEKLSAIGFLNLKHFVPISTPNLHQEPGGIDRAVEAALNYGKPAVYLVSAGVSAAVIIDRLHDRIKDSWFLDCGSIWDGFVGIGGQREWRAKLYANRQNWKAWISKNING